MLQIQDVKGVIFDVDDTLLDNVRGKDPTEGLHELSRMAAIQEAGHLHGIVSLQNVSGQEILDAFHLASTHTLVGAVWYTLRLHGLVDSDVIDPDNQLLQEIVELKNKGHEAILREHGREIKDASVFVRTLASNGLESAMAIASSAVRRDIDIFLDMTKLTGYFPDEHIISVEKVTKFKPDPQCFDLAFQSLGLPEKDRRQVLVFEDDPRGVHSAKAAGLYVCAITTRFKSTTDVLQDAGADVVADSYAEFAAALGVFLKL